MNILKISVIVAVFLISGCAQVQTQTRQLEQWKRQAESLIEIVSPEEVTYKADLHGKAYSRALEIAVPKHYCDPSVFMKGVESGYVLSWNQMISDNSSFHRLRYSNNPGDELAAFNFNLYANKNLPATEIAKYKYRYASNVGHCYYRAFQAGEIEGRELAKQDFYQIKNKEIY